MSAVHLYVFDWDGTLIDSVPRIVHCLKRAAETLQFRILSDEAYGDVIGLGLPQAIARLYPGLDADWAEAYRQQYAEAFVSADGEPSAFFPGALETLDALRSRGHRLAVATGKSRRGLDRVLQRHGLAGFFDATRCADETASKPDPTMLHQIFAELDVPAAQSLMVGDTEYDLDMAARAGVRSVGVSYGVHSRERLARHAPLRIIDALPQLLESG
ncbi:MAG: HAD family hydrolase [Gammaproteobacteria bacterium]